MQLTPDEYPTDGTILLRSYQPDDAPETLAMVLESLEMLKPWMSWAHNGYTLAEAQAFIQASQGAWESDRGYDFVIVSAADGSLLGGCGLTHLDLHPTRRLANLGYWVRQGQRGQGLAPRAARLVGRWGIERLHLLRAEIVVAVGNTASLRVAEKCGAKREGVLRNRMVVGEKIYNGVMHSLTPQDFGIGTWLSLTEQGQRTVE